jgi:hypothetical protein
MRTSRYVVLTSVLALVGIACQTREPQKAAPDPSGDYRPTASIKDIMDSMVDPSADFIWESVATIVTPAGTEKRGPKTAEDWTNVRRRAVILVEATNVLLIPGRRVAKPGENSANPNIELEPEQIEALLTKDRQAWVNYVHGLHDAAAEMLAAIDDKKASVLFEDGEKLDTACENCHQHYWYPSVLSKSP